MSLSNISYTNKDFNSIYVELLEYAKKLSEKWDPSASAESDPGVVLLKLAAIIGDKNNYNIDKNVLELMPGSVSQPAIARQVFDQCGYYMQYYRAAEGQLTLKLHTHLGDDIYEDQAYTYKIPQFTLFSDADNTLTYCTTQENTIEKDTEAIVDIIEGMPITYTINNDPLITTANLDSKNRLYLTETNIAENGIFISNSENKRIVWNRVDNLYIEQKGSYIFKFGITKDESTCYIEFPEDAESLFGSGVNITYVTTNGARGNVRKDRVKFLYADTTITRVSNYGDTEVSVTNDDLSIRNLQDVNGGADPESIDSAYKSYRRVKDTFNTLVSLRDYTNYLTTSKAASNGYVCDRTNDIESAYKMLTNNNGFKSTKIIVHSDANSKPELDAFNLRVYALKYVPTVDSRYSYKQTFALTDGSQFETVVNQDEVKSLQHDFKPFETDRILMLKNKYSIATNIVPKHTLSGTEKYDILNKIELNLQQAVNAKEIEFGKEISLTTLQNAILSSDERLSALVDMSSLTYQTYAVYLDTNGKFQEIRIDDESFDAGYVPVKVTHNSFSSSNLYYLNVRDNKIEKVEAGDKYDKRKQYYEYNESLHNLWNKFRVEIFTKNVVSGVTPLYKQADPYLITLNQKDTTEHEHIDSFTTSSTLAFEKQDVGDVSTWNAKVRNNESIVLTCPNVTEELNFSSYTKMIYKFNNAVRSNEYHQLQNGEYVVLFWIDKNEDTDYTVIKYDKNSTANIIKFSGFSITDKTSSTDYTNDTTGGYFFRDNLPSGVKTKTNSVVTHSELGNKTETEFIKDDLLSTKNFSVLTGTNIVASYKVNTIIANNTTNGCTAYYWILNNSDNVLFKKDSTASYILKSGEYFMYTDSQKRKVYLYGEGTKVAYGTTASADWTCAKINYEDLLIEGIDLIEDWYTIPLSNDSSKQLTITENQVITIGPGNTLVIGPKLESIAETALNITTEGIDLGNRTSLYYVDESNNTNPIPTNNFSGGWFARTVLNVVADAQTPFILEEGQSVTLHNTSATEDTELSMGTAIFPNTSLYLVSDGSNIDVSEYNDTAGLSLLTCNINPDFPLTNENLFEFELSSDNTEETIESTLLPGTYLMSIVVSADVTLDVSCTGASLEPVTTNLFKVFAENNSNTVTWTFTLGEDAQEGKSYKVSIKPLYKYSNENLKQYTHTETDPDSFEEAVLDYLKTLDKNDEFDYLNTIELPIDNPLNAQTFLDPDHFYNKFTICEWDGVVEATSIKIHDVLR